MCVLFACADFRYPLSCVYQKKSTKKIRKKSTRKSKILQPSQVPNIFTVIVDTLLLPRESWHIRTRNVSDLRSLGPVRSIVVNGLSFNNVGFEYYSFEDLCKVP